MASNLLYFIQGKLFHKRKSSSKTDFFTTYQYTGAIMQIDLRQYEFVIPNSLGWSYDSTSTQAASSAAATSSGDSVSLGQSSRQKMEEEQTSLEQILKAKGCSLQDALKDILISGKYLQEYLDTGIVPSACPGYQKGNITQTQDSLTSPQGMRVDVSTSYQNAVVTGASVSVTRANGQQVTFDAACNVRLNEREDGSLAVTFADTGETRIFAQDGSVTSEQGTAGALSGTDGDDVFLQLTAASSIDAGNGNDSILVLASGGTTSAGAGNDTIVVGKTVGGTTSIDAGSGNDTLRGNELRRSLSIEMGDGDDTVDVQSYAGNMNLGQGNNALTAHYAAGRLSAGDGSNTVTATNILGAMIFGDGANQVTTSTGSGNVTLGKGNNTITGDSWLGGSITAGEGDNHIRIRSLEGNIIAGNGNNTINVDSMASSNSSAMVLGHGDNTVTMRSTSGNIQMGDGNNTLRWDSAMDASIKIGNGNNTVIGRSQSPFDDLVLGDGNNTLELSSNNAGYTHIASNVLGNGQNTIFLGGYGEQVKHGSGNNTYLNWTMTQNEIQARNDANQTFMDNWRKSNFG
ncbi:hypothetical protein JMF94_11205 [Desulfovibrio sp. UIB00]|uniref:hypothetical protein n=1 Tax=Desulfovibrio sp. UIB00 TaxID=2804314 RepID=UPI001F10E94D|nr:hypothetical protein [Desulfovibrio sp. UIB00]MCH5145649.1 hypothetical protein [Desulfovibrio sp. UIB00]